MAYLQQHKALLITILLMGSVVFSMFSIHISKKDVFIAESLYEIEPKTEEELFEERLQENQKKAITINKAFNEDDAFKEMMSNFKTLPNNDFDKTIQNKTTASTEETNVHSKSQFLKNRALALNENEHASYKKLNDLLKQKTGDKDIADEHSKSESSFNYSLKGRTLTYYDTPRYLCETYGKIVISITVNGNGKVISSSVNGASNSTNQCLIESAIAYASSVKFSTSDKKEQIGTITFLFKGKK